MVTIRWLREQIRQGKTIYDLPLRVTFYARVSTEKVEQQGSLENQIQYYTEFIQKNPNWTYVPGYIDEGISGTSTYKRDSFLRMIEDAKRGMFDFIITKEISRFSRNTLDSIQYTQELLDNNVGVLFQNDNINTLDSDSEFRLIVMAGVAQDEVRKLSERLKFGFRQSIKNGHVLGNNRLWGYDKKDCKLTIIPEQAEAVKLIFQLYATGNYGLRKLSQELTRRGYTSLLGNKFNSVTIGHILQNPKYKGWYCGNKTQSLDYRKKKTAFLDESEWVTYPDPNIPAIVSEELWNQANEIFKKRSARTKAYGVGYQSRYPYSGKIICGKHGTAFHRQSFKTMEGHTEFWQCRMYREHGKAGCDLPTLRTKELDAILADQFQKLVKNQKQIVRLVMDSVSSVQQKRDYSGQITQLNTQISQLEEKKDKLLELSIANAITIQEFKKRNNRFNEQIADMQEQMISLQKLEENGSAASVDLSAIEKALWQELSFQDTISTEVVAAILDHVVVCEGSTKQRIDLELYLRLGQTASVTFSRERFAFWNTSSSRCVRPDAGCVPQACCALQDRPQAYARRSRVPPAPKADAETNRYCLQDAAKAAASGPADKWRLKAWIFPLSFFVSLWLNGKSLCKKRLPLGRRFSYFFHSCVGDRNTKHKYAVFRLERTQAVAASGNIADAAAAIAVPLPCRNRHLLAHGDASGIRVRDLDKQIVSAQAAVERDRPLRGRQLRSGMQCVLKPVGQDRAQLGIRQRELSGQLCAHLKRDPLLFRLLRKRGDQQIDKAVGAVAARHDRVRICIYPADIRTGLIRLLRGKEGVDRAKMMTHIMLIDSHLRLSAAQTLHLDLRLLQLRLQHGALQLRIRLRLHLAVIG